VTAEPGEGDQVLGQLAALLRASYGFTDVAIGERLEGGYANDLFHVTADGGESVLRVKYPPVHADDIAWEHRLQRVLARRLDEVQAPLAAVDGSTYFSIEQRAAWLVPFVAGETADPAREQHRLAAARALGRLHRAGSDIGVEPRPRQTPLRELPWPPLTVPPELKAWGAEIADARAWAVSFVEALHETRPLATSLVHGDFFPGNVLVTADRVVAVIDWEEAQFDWVIWDLAGALGSFCGVDDGFDRAAAARFVAAYRAAGGTAAPDDDDALLPLVRVKRILEVLRAPTDREPRWEHQRRNLRSLSNLPVAPTRPSP
jgi:Ser/Thr protein kinase RdoA (MazF antagonist)